MSVECCGKSRETPFCPQCGKQLGSNHDLAGLLAHIRKSGRDAQKRHEMCLRCAANTRGADSENYRQRAEANASLAEKWNAWADALVVLLASGE